MKATDFIRQTLRPIRTKMLESGLIVLTIAVGVGMMTGFSSLINMNRKYSATTQNRLEYREMQLETAGHEAEPNRNTETSQVITELQPVAQPLPKVSLAMVADIKAQIPAIEYTYITTEELLDSRSDAPNGSIGLARVTPDYIRASRLELVSGSWFSNADMNTGLIVISDQYAQHIFGKTAVLGKTIQNIKADLSQQTLKIIGVFAAKNHSVYWSTTNTTGIMGIAPYIGNFSTGAIELSLVKFVAKIGKFDLAKEQLLSYATQRWGNRVKVYSRQQELLTAQKSTNSMTTTLIAFTSLGLVIACLNVTNLMMARVKSRTRQIGIIGALGASKKLVYWLVLGESMMLGLLGALGGLVLAWVIISLVNSASQNPQFQAQLGVLEVTFCFGLSVLLATIFGLIPASIAARQPITLALRR